MLVDYDVAVIGGGPGGYIAAIRAAQLGLKVVCVDAWKNGDRPAPGGTCTNVGCIPSKALLESSAAYEMSTQALPGLGVQIDHARLDLSKMQTRRGAIIRQNNDGIVYLFRKNKVQFICGTARILGSEQQAYRIAVTGEQSHELTCEHIIIATGSAPRAWPGLAFDEKRILSNTGILSMADVPKNLAIIGAGVVGLEMGSVWRRLGSQVSMFESQPMLLAGADKQIADEAHKQLSRQGLSINTGVTITHVGLTDEGVHMTYDDAQGQQQNRMFDRVLVSIGRVPYTEGLGIENIGVKLDERGAVLVDGACRTHVRNVWAIGDVVRGPMLAHKAQEEGIAVAERIAGKGGHVDYRNIPWVVYTHPEIAWVGKTQEQLVSEGVAFHSGSFPFMANGRARTMGQTEGFVKMLTDENDTVVGVHIIGPMASEMIAQAAMAMNFGATAEDIARICHAHPTLSEAMREAALSVENRALNL